MNRRIGVLDSGIGGLSVVSSLQKVLPNEDILYFGDSKNVPYGNKDEKEILYLTTKIFEFLSEKNVKLIVIACNTISALVNKYKTRFNYPLIDIINPTIEYIDSLKLDNLALLGTEFTIGSQIYQSHLIKKNKQIKIVTESSKTLAAIIDSGEFSSKRIKIIIKDHLKSITNKNVKNIILVCTHYLIVYNLFLEDCPKINFIDPGYHQALATKDYLSKNNLLNNKNQGLLNIFTSGEIKVYKNAAAALKLKNITDIKKIQLR